MADVGPPDPPQDGGNRVAQALGALVRVDRSSLLEAGGASVNITHPLPIYGLGVPDPESSPDTLLSRTTLVGWRYLANGLSMVVDIRLTGPQRPEILRGAGIAERFVAAVSLAEAACPDPERCDLRLLDFNQLGRFAVWLHADREDRFFGLARPVHELDGRRFLAEVSSAERIKARAHANTSPEAGG